MPIHLRLADTLFTNVYPYVIPSAKYYRHHSTHRYIGSDIPSWQNWALYVIAVLSPAVLQGVVNLLTVRLWWDLHSSLLGRKHTQVFWKIPTYPSPSSISTPGSFTYRLNHAICEAHRRKAATWYVYLYVYFATSSCELMIHLPIDVISRCIPAPGSVDPPLGLSSVEICTRAA